MKSLGWIKIFTLFAIGFFPLLFIIFLNAVFDFAINFCPLYLTGCDLPLLSCPIYGVFIGYFLIMTIEALGLIVWEALAGKFHFKKASSTRFWWYLIIPLILAITLNFYLYFSHLIKVINYTRSYGGCL